MQKGGSSNPLNELAGQTNQSGSQYYRRQMTCRELRIPSSSRDAPLRFLDSTLPGLSPRCYSDRFEIARDQILTARRSFSRTIDLALIETFADRLQLLKLSSGRSYSTAVLTIRCFDGYMVRQKRHRPGVLRESCMPIGTRSDTTGA